MTKDGTLTCVACGHEAGYNRAVVDTIADELVGGLCLPCERVNYGTDLGASADPDHECTFCEHDGFYALPKWLVQDLSRSSRRGTVTVSYAIEGTTTRLCDGHFHAVATALEPATAPADEPESYDRL